MLFSQSGGGFLLPLTLFAGYTYGDIADRASNAGGDG
jgi:hypothetical protein